MSLFYVLVAPYSPLSRVCVLRCVCVAFAVFWNLFLRSVVMRAFAVSLRFLASIPPLQTLKEAASATQRGRQSERQRGRRSPSPQRASRRRSASPARRSSGNSDFFRGASSSGAQVCAVCLGRHKDGKVRFADCSATATWDKNHDTFSRRSSQGVLVTVSDNEPLCLDWQRERGCSVARHGARHKCSGCGSTDHGASACPRAEKV
jgi:hypothetical protein